MLAAMGSVLYFVVNDADTSPSCMQLWKTDGSAAGTTKMGAFESCQGRVAALFVASNALYWTIQDTHNCSTVPPAVLYCTDAPLFYVPINYQVWRTDGTISGTIQLGDFPFHKAMCTRYGCFSNTEPTPPDHFVEYAGKVYFRADRGGESTGDFSIYSQDIWNTDGTISGTSKVNFGTLSLHPFDLIAFKGMLHLLSFDIVNGLLQLAATDGTVTETRIITTFLTSAFSGAYARNTFTIYNNQLFFNSNTGTDDELWKSDGTTAGTVRVKDINPGTASSSPSNLVVMNGLLIFQAYSSTGFGLWTTNGTAAGTQKIMNMQPCDGHFISTSMIGINSRLLFWQWELAHGCEPWVSDLTAANPVMLNDTNAQPESAKIADMIQVGDVAYFTALDGNRRLLWRSDGTLTGTLPLKDLGIDTYSVGGSVSDLFVPADNRLFFFVNEGLNFGLWVSDGTVSGTQKLASVDLSGRQELWRTGFKNKLLFTAFHSSLGGELWISDGTPAGTKVLKDICLGTGSSFPAHFVAANNQVYFQADDCVHGRELWRSDGTAAGTMMIKDLTPNADTNIDFAVPVGDKLFFATNNGLRPPWISEWVTDGTAAGTVFLHQIQNTCANARKGWALGTQLIYEVFACVTVLSQLWRSDGTVTGTISLAQAPGSTWFDATVVNGVWYGVVPASNHTLLLWRSDGSVNGTYQFSAIPFSGIFPNIALPPTPFKGHVLFGTLEPTYTQLWWTDGSIANTYQLPSISPIIQGPLVINDRLLWHGPDESGSDQLRSLVFPNEVSSDLHADATAFANTQSIGLLGEVRARYGNWGLTSAPSFTLTAELAPGLTYVSDTLGISPTLTGQHLTWVLTDTALGQHAFNIQVQLPLSGTLETRYPVTLTLTSAQDSDPTDNIARVDVVTARPIYVPIVQEVFCLVVVC